MSTTTVYTIAEAIRSTIQSNYTEKKELTNRIDLEKNSNHLLANGFDVIVGPAENTGEMRGRGIATSRDMSIILTKRVYDSDLQNASKHATEQTLFEELIDIGSLITSGQTVVRLVNDVEISGDSGIEVIDAEKVKHLKTQLDLTVRYVESYN